MEKMYANFCLLFVAILLALWQSSEAANCDTAAKPSIFVFGDSTVDAGTNTYIPAAESRADHIYYGIDSPHFRSSGRYSDGFNVADFLAKLWGQRRSPDPYLVLLKHKHGLRRRCFRGANFASGAAGVFDSTDKEEHIVPMSEQLRQFENIRSNLSVVKGPALTESIIRNGVFLLSVGSNDLFEIMTLVAEAKEKNQTLIPIPMVKELVEAYFSYVEALYKLGARKFAIINTPPFGCTPGARAYFKTEGGGCPDPPNMLARIFNGLIKNKIENSTLPEMKYAYADSYAMTMNLIDNPEKYNIKNVDTACCGGGLFNGIELCNKTSNLCPNRNHYLFWDRTHPTMHTAKIAAEVMYKDTGKYVTPINFAQLVAA